MRSIIERLVSALFMILFMQIPAFIQTYTQILAGHVAELNYQIGKYQQIADKNHKSLPDLVHRFLKSDDSEIASLGQILNHLLERFDKLKNSLDLLTHSPAWKKPFIFFSQLDFSVLKESFSHYTLGLPLTLESLAYGLIGIVISIILTKLGGLRAARTRLAE